MKKIIEIFGSQNAYVTALNIILGFFVYNQIEPGMTAEEIVAALAGKDIMNAVTFVVINFFNVFVKLGKKVAAGEWSWGFLKSPNFLTQVMTLATIILTFLFDEVIAGIIVTIAINAINFFYHVVAPKKGVVTK